MYFQWKVSVERFNPRLNNFMKYLVLNARSEILKNSLMKIWIFFNMDEFEALVWKSGQIRKPDFWGGLPRSWDSKMLKEYSIALKKMK